MFFKQLSVQREKPREAFFQSSILDNHHHHFTCFLVLGFFRNFSDRSILFADNSYVYDCMIFSQGEYFKLIIKRIKNHTQKSSKQY